ncbi:unnamed protein product [Blepharisma stoltei]|uniref:Uncharacterized protein n=1 Tax=Blepharisma stoltei TaxID=1481888 RepID=A0AAU9K545_9CILI|nr:unnamed protein product [Blepharisma stoltei]
MGCGGSKKKTKINIEMEVCNLVDIDNMFSAAAEPLATLDKVSHKLNKHIRKLKKAAGCHIIKDATFKDALDSMLYCYSASTDGDFSKINLEIVPEKPYVNIERHGLKPEHHHIADAWNDMLEAIEESVAKAAELPGQLKEFFEKIPDFPSQAKSALENANMIDKARGIKCCATNVSRLTAASKILTEFTKTIAEVTQALASFASKCTSEERAKIEKIGKDAHKDHVYVPKDIIRKFWPDPTKIDLTLDKPPKPKKK